VLSKIMNPERKNELAFSRAWCLMPAICSLSENYRNRAIVLFTLGLIERADAIEAGRIRLYLLHSSNLDLFTFSTSIINIIMY
jgi:hypothetical protein